MTTPSIPDFDLYLFGEGTCLRLYDHFGAHAAEKNGVRGVRFAVWAPNARRVSVIGNFNNWNAAKNVMKMRADSGVWELFIPGVQFGDLYRYDVVTPDGASIVHSDPFGFQMETPPQSASIVYDLENYHWTDSEWIRRRADLAKPDSLQKGAAISIYEAHLGSWRRGDGGRFLTYLELAEMLPAYVKKMGFTHVELMPVAEHPFYGSWGYQQTGFFAPTSRYGSPKEFMALIDAFHNNGIGVILDWVPAHFPTDGYGLARFDGTALYEHLDPRKGFHQDWKTYIFNYERNEVRNFLLANALYWIDKYHIDGLRVDAVSSMLYLDYSRKEGEWIPNKYGGRENIEAIEFLKIVNATVSEKFPGVTMIAEESTAFAGVTRPQYLGGLGFHYKWNLGWMHDWLKFFAKDPVMRKFHTGQITFAMWYAYTEKYILMLGHDEVVHMKGSLLNKMPGAGEQKAANLRSLFTMMYCHPGKKLLFMGSELAPWSEWNHDRGLEWELLSSPLHAGIHKLVSDLNHLYQSREELYLLDDYADGFEWIDFSDVDNTTFSWLRFGAGREKAVLIVANVTPVARVNYQIGVPRPGFYKEILNSDGREYGGAGIGNLGGVIAGDEPRHQRPHSISLTLPPLGVVILELPPAPPPAPASAKPAEKKPVKKTAANRTIKKDKITKPSVRAGAAGKKKSRR
ncbi:MAG: 1,4-alpha-glucan branching protein GlgB [Planctomycetota bacterium]